MFQQRYEGSQSIWRRGVWRRWRPVRPDRQRRAWAACQGSLRLRGSWTGRTFLQNWSVEAEPSNVCHEAAFQASSSRSSRTRMNRAGARGGRMAGLASTLPTTWRMSSEVKWGVRRGQRTEQDILCRVAIKVNIIDCSKLYNSHVLQAISSLFCLSLQFECNTQQFSLNLFSQIGFKKWMICFESLILVSLIKV